MELIKYFRLFCDIQLQNKDEKEKIKIFFNEWRPISYKV